MTTSRNTGLNDIPTDDQNYFCQHWTQSRRVLEILKTPVNDPDLEAQVEEVLTHGEQIDHLLQKGQPSKRRTLYQNNSAGLRRESN